MRPPFRPSRARGMMSMRRRGISQAAYPANDGFFSGLNFFSAFSSRAWTSETTSSFSWSVMCIPRVRRHTSICRMAQDSASRMGSLNVAIRPSRSRWGSPSGLRWQPISRAVLGALWLSCGMRCRVSDRYDNIDVGQSAYSWSNRQVAERTCWFLPPRFQVPSSLMNLSTQASTTIRSPNCDTRITGA